MHRTQRRGVAAFYIIVLMTLLCGVASLAVDYGRVQLAKTELRRAADAAARAGASSVPADITTATSLAVKYAALNVADGSPVELDPSNDIDFGLWTSSTKTFTKLTGNSLTGANAIRVTARRNFARKNAVPLLFANLLGVSSTDVSASSVALLTKGGSGYGIIGLDFVSMSGSASVDSYISSEGSYSTLSARDHGNVASNGNITMSGGAHIEGDANPGEGMTVSGGNVTGSRKPLTEPIVKPPAEAGTAEFINNNANVAQYIKNGSFSISGQKTADFPTGVYYFQNFTASGGAKINANVNGPVIIYVAGDLTLTGGSSAYDGDAQNLQIILLNSGTKADFTGNSAIYVDLYAPLSKVTLSGTTDVFGQIVGKSVTITGSGYMHYDEKMTAPFVKKIMVVE
jgi:Flp pilus assembly protein TadG